MTGWPCFFKVWKKTISSFIKKKKNKIEARHAKFEQSIDERKGIKKKRKWGKRKWGLAPFILNEKRIFYRIII